MINLPPTWHPESKDSYGVSIRTFYVRIDGAEVWKTDDEYYSNPLNPRARFWCARGPNGRYLAVAQQRRSRRLHPPNAFRRWKTPEAAMKALDREYPISSAAGAE